MRDGHPKANGFWGQLELATIRVGALGNRQPNEIQYGDLEFGEVSVRTSSGGGGVELNLFAVCNCRAKGDWTLVLNGSFHWSLPFDRVPLIKNQRFE